MLHQFKNAEFHLSPAELLQLIEAAPTPRDRLIMQLFVYTGLRRAELQRISVEDLDFSRRRLLIRRGKGGKQRILYLSDSVMAAIQHHLLEREVKSRYLFPGSGGGLMSLRNINYIVGRVAFIAGVTTPNPRYRQVGPHLLRHSFARNWKRIGGSLESLQKILGHRSLKTTLDIYGCESQEETEANYRQTIDRLVLG